MYVSVAIQVSMAQTYSGFKNGSIKFSLLRRKCSFSKPKRILDQLANPLGPQQSYIEKLAITAGQLAYRFTFI